MIKSFKCKNTQSLFHGTRVKEWVNIERTALKKLTVLNAAYKLSDLQTPENSLEKLKRDRAGQHSIRINDQWRVCFVWNEGAEDVEIVDYH